MAETEEAEVSTTHPDYDRIFPDWELVRHSIEGENAVKAQDQTYLPMPSGFKAQDDKGVEMYGQYKLRAKFPEIMGPTLRGMVGIIHRIAAEIQLPAQLEPLREKATADGLDLNALHERITYELMATGRYGLMADAPIAGAEVPYIAGYKAETIINWSLDHDFFVLDETDLEREGFGWEEREQYRVLEKRNGVYSVTTWKETENGDLVAETPIIPQARGGRPLDRIPFVVVGSTDVGPDLDEIPLIGVARCAFNMYRLDADYKWQLFMSGQETLFVYSDSETAITIVGAGVVHKLPKESQAEYVGPSGQGIEAHERAIEREKTDAVMAGAKMFDTEKKAQESGEALKIRWAAQTASLTTVAINSAKGLETVLKDAALFVGANPDEVVVKPNLRFIDSALTPRDAMDLVKAWQAGAISYETLWDNLQRGDIGSYEKTAEEELELIEQETPDIAPPSPTPPVDPVTGQPVPPTSQAGNGAVPTGGSNPEDAQPA